MRPAANVSAAAAGSLAIVTEVTDRENTEEPYAFRGHMTPTEAGALAHDPYVNFFILSSLWVEEDPFRAIQGASRILGGTVKLATPGLHIGWETR